MNLLATAALLLPSFAAVAEQAAAQSVEQTSPFGVVAFFAAVVAAGVGFFIAMNRASGKAPDDKKNENE